MRIRTIHRTGTGSLAPVSAPSASSIPAASSVSGSVPAIAGSTSSVAPPVPVASSASMPSSASVGSVSSLSAATSGAPDVPASTTNLNQGGSNSGVSNTQASTKCGGQGKTVIINNVNKLVSTEGDADCSKSSSSQSN